VIKPSDWPHFGFPITGIHCQLAHSSGDWVRKFQNKANDSFLCKKFLIQLQRQALRRVV
jgi:hypothetical protein